MNKAMELNSYIVEPKIRPFGKSTVPFLEHPHLLGGTGLSPRSSSLREMKEAVSN